MEGKVKKYRNIAVNSSGDHVGWNASDKHLPFAVHMLFHPNTAKPSRCFFYSTQKEALEFKDHMMSKLNRNIGKYKFTQRIELCKSII